MNQTRNRKHHEGVFEEVGRIRNVVFFLFVFFAENDDLFEKKNSAVFEEFFCGLFCAVASMGCVWGVGSKGGMRGMWGVKGWSELHDLEGVL